MKTLGKNGGKKKIQELKNCISLVLKTHRTPGRAQILSGIRKKAMASPRSAQPESNLELTSSRKRKGEQKESQRQQKRKVEVRIDRPNMMPSVVNSTDLTSKFNRNIRPLLDAVDKLRNLKVTNEGIPLPSIVVVGDQSSGKSSVLESLATINLPRGQGIATRVPLVLRLQSCRNPEDSAITISYKDVTRRIQEEDIEDEVNAATNVLAGTGKGVVTDTVISLHIRKPNAPDLTMIDLPGITRVPVHGQPADIYEQISSMIRKYIKPQQTVILNVLSATVDFSTCESIRMSQEADKEGERTLAVVTKVDRAPDDVYKKVTEDDVNIGLGYVCVRNRTDDDESHEEARLKEKNLFKTHPALSRIDEICVGIPSLAERLTQIQANIIRLSLPGIHGQIDRALMERRKQLEALPQFFANGEDPTGVFLNIVDQCKSTIQDVVLNGNYEIVANDNEMHYSARIDEMFERFSDKLHKVVNDILPETRTKDILLRMTEMRGLTLPNFLSPTLMKTLVSEEIGKVSEVCIDLVPQTHDYAMKFVFNIIEKATNAFPKLQYAFKQEAERVVEACKTKCMEYVRRVLDKERTSVFTMNDSYMRNVQKMREHLIKLREHDPEYDEKVDAHIEVEGFKEPFSLEEAYNESNEYQSALDMKINLAAYFKVVQKRMADDIPQELRYALQNTLVSALRSSIVKAKFGQDMSKLVEESASTNAKRVALSNRVNTLTQCKAVLSQLS